MDVDGRALLIRHQGSRLWCRSYAELVHGFPSNENIPGDERRAGHGRDVLDLRCHHGRRHGVHPLPGRRNQRKDLPWDPSRTSGWHSTRQASSLIPSSIYKKTYLNPLHRSNLHSLEKNRYRKSNNHRKPYLAQIPHDFIHIDGIAKSFVVLGTSGSMGSTNLIKSIKHVDHAISRCARGATIDPECHRGIPASCSVKSITWQTRGVVVSLLDRNFVMAIPSGRVVGDIDYRKWSDITAVSATLQWSDSRCNSDGSLCMSFPYFPFFSSLTRIRMPAASSTLCR